MATRRVSRGNSARTYTASCYWCKHGIQDTSKLAARLASHWSVEAQGVHGSALKCRCEDRTSHCVTAFSQHRQGMPQVLDAPEDHRELSVDEPRTHYLSRLRPSHTQGAIRLRRLRVLRTHKE